jgi:hypothetical protein
MRTDRPEPQDLAAARITGEPLAVLGRQAEQIAFFSPVSAEASTGFVPEPVINHENIARTDLPRNIVALLDQYERDRGTTLRPLRLLQFDAQQPTANLAASTPLPDVEQLVTLSITETVITADTLTVRSYVLFAQPETTV